MRKLCGSIGIPTSVTSDMHCANIPANQSIIRDTYALATDSQGHIIQEDGILVAINGRPRFDTALADSANTALHILKLWRQYGRDVLSHVHGPFALAIIDTHANICLLAIDRVGIHAMAFAALPVGLVFSNRADEVAAHPAIKATIDPQGIFNFFYFYETPSPGTVFHGVHKLVPGEYLWFENGQVTRDFYWRLHYQDEGRSDFAEMSNRFHGLLRESVARAKGMDNPAAFLSGGTDSSTVAGILSKLQDTPPRTYSIGFSAEGFDEIAYARIAAKHFGLDSREHYITPDDIMTAIPVIASHYDEPFGNESAVPTYICAKLAQNDGYRVMLAGDGGDELFGGNARYAKQKVFETYHRLPSLLRAGLIEPLANIPGVGRIPHGAKLQSYLRQANIPLPERMESYNHINRQPLRDMFTPYLLAQVDSHQPLAWLKEAYDRTDSHSFINRMMHLDMKFTIADNDLRKVNGMTEAAGIEVRYPLLDDAMVNFSGEVPPDWKVKGQYLRWFFKNALRGFLPDEIIDKSKHGFGLPFGIWARDYAPLRERIEDRLSDFKKRNWLQPAFIDDIRAQHMSGHATYYGRMLWAILILEEWLVSHQR